MTKTAAIIGGGVIGGGWAARFLLNGWNVTVFDPDPEAARKIDEVLANARRALPGLYDALLPAEGALRFESDLAAAVSGADWVQESVPERLELKHRILGQIAQAAPASAVIGSSTSGFKPSELTAHGARAIVAHPFNPVYLLPLVELVGDAETCIRASDLLRGIGMFPQHIRKEIDAHIGDRLLESIWRESLWLVQDGIATTEEIDETIRMGFGLRWAQMGLFETYRIAGGEAGMKHFMAQFGPALKWPWSRLTEVPEFTDKLVDLIAGQSEAQSGHLSIRALERLRDDNLVAMMRALKRTGSGAGGVIRAHEATLPAPEAADLPVTASVQVPTSWTDYNGHMNETHYLELGSRASDRTMELIGADAAYIDKGLSYFTVENHVRYLDEVRAGTRLRVTTQLLDGAGKRLHLFHRLLRDDGVVVATVESLLIHVDLGTRRSAPPAPQVAARLAELAASHAAHPRPEGLTAAR
ncbi:MAG: carnitine 3-dehydrogenase [Roseivivax sp.]|nr:carnitine 3-dehydrogenase [Roseivivax sp.]